MSEKPCSKCGEVKPLDEFKKDSRIPGGRAAYCKVCARKAKKAYRQRPDIKKRNAEYRKEHRVIHIYDYGDRYKGRYNWSDYYQTVKAWHDKHPLAERAYRLIQKAIKSGDIPKASECPCAHCGKAANDYHHHNGYGEGHELDVVALCRACHRIAHSQWA